MTFQERMAVALARSKHKQTIPAVVTTTPIKKKNMTPHQYQATTLERVIAKIKIKKEMI